MKPFCNITHILFKKITAYPCFQKKKNPHTHTGFILTKEITINIWDVNRHVPSLYAGSSFERRIDVDPLKCQTSCIVYIGEVTLIKLGTSRGQIVQQAE